MSWLFGYGSSAKPEQSAGQNDDTSNMPQLNMDSLASSSGGVGGVKTGAGLFGGFGQSPSSSSQMAGGGQLSGQKSSQPEIKMPSGYHFDSTGLERAAKAARELEKSPLAKQTLELSKLQESTKQEELRTQAKQYEAALAEAQIEQKRVDYQERRKQMEEEARIAKQKAEYQDQLARKRYQDQLGQQKRAQEEQLALQKRAQEENLAKEMRAQEERLKREEESVARQEQMRRKTIEHEQEMRTKHDLKRIETKIREKAKADRKNREINLEKMKQEAAEYRTTVLESIKTTTDVLGTGFNNFINNKQKVITAAMGISMAAFGIYAAKYSLRVGARAIEARITKPKLVAETSRLNVQDLILHPVKTAKRFSEVRRGDDALKDVILSPKLEEQLRDLAIATRNMKRNKGTHMNVLFHGPPGTGKTLVAKKLAVHSGMDYAVMSGGNVAPLGADAVTEIHKVFDSAETSRRGLLLFIDEADAFLNQRYSNYINQDMNNVLSAFLQRTGTESTKFMLVFAANEVDYLDWAVRDRIDSYIEFGKPGLSERERLIRLYFDKYILQPASEGRRRLKVDNFDYDKMCSKIAEMTSGYSAREISKLGPAWQAATYTSLEGVLTEHIVWKIVESSLKSHKEKEKFELLGTRHKINPAAQVSPAKATA